RRDPEPGCESPRPSLARASPAARSTPAAQTRRARRLLRRSPSLPGPARAAGPTPWLEAPLGPARAQDGGTIALRRPLRPTGRTTRPPASALRNRPRAEAPPPAGPRGGGCSPFPPGPTALVASASGRAPPPRAPVRARIARMRSAARIPAPVPATGPAVAPSGAGGPLDHRR